jgi:hypothetical protein
MSVLAISRVENRRIKIEITWSIYSYPAFFFSKILSYSIVCFGNLLVKKNEIKSEYLEYLLKNTALHTLKFRAKIVGFGYFFVENNKIEIKNVAFIQKNRYYFF